MLSRKLWRRQNFKKSRVLRHTHRVDGGLHIFDGANDDLSAVYTVGGVLVWQVLMGDNCHTPRVKLYKLNDSGQWDDWGTGQVAVGLQVSKGALAVEILVFHG